MSATSPTGAPTPSAERHGCGAPHAALYLSPTGSVQACCRNDDLTLRTGSGIGRQTLREIWNGPKLRRLRDAVDAGDYSLGCQSCGFAIAAGERHKSVAADFDRYLGARNLDGPKHLDLALSNTCNLSCEMCSGDLSSTIRSRREHRPPLRSPYDDSFFEELRELLPSVESVIFKGGEPFLATEAQRVWELMIEARSTAHVTVVTNGTRWDASIERWLRSLKMDVHVSIDGATAATVEAIRTGADHAQVRANLDRFVTTAADYGGTVAWNFCHMPQNAHELGQVLVDADSLDIDVHVIPVYSPPRFAFHAQPLEALESLVHLLEEQEPTVRPLLGRNLGVWDQELTMLRRAAMARRDADEVPVVLRRDQDLAAFEAEVARLESWSGRVPILITIDDAIVTHVEAASWASNLDPQSWVGRGGQDLIDLLAANLGPVHDVATTVDRAPVLETSLRFGTGEPTHAVRSVRTSGEAFAGAERVRVALAVQELRDP